MQLPPFEYIRPASLAEGLQLLADRPGDVAVMAGGTDLLLNMKFRLESPKYLLSLNGLAEMQQVEEQMVQLEANGQTWSSADADVAPVAS